MRTISLMIIFGLFACNIFAQSLDDFYNKTFEIYTPFSGMSSVSKTLDSLDFDKSMNFLGSN